MYSYHQVFVVSCVAEGGADIMKSIQKTLYDHFYYKPDNFRFRLKWKIVNEFNKQTPAPEPTQEAKSPKASASPAESRMGDTRVVNGEKQIYFLGFGWIKDEGGVQQRMIGSPDDELTGNKVGQMGGGTTEHGKGDINKMVVIMGADDAPPSTHSEPLPDVGEVIGQTINDVPLKNSTPPSEKPTPAPGEKTVIDGKPSVWVPGFG